jgi:hypothetical protein
MFGAAGGNDEYVSISDGGHFDNSGIYELVRRRCRYIIFVDSAGEASPANVLFDTIGNAARLARVDFGVDIEIDLAPVTPDPRTGRTPASFVVGRVLYPRSNRPDVTPEQDDAERQGIFVLLRSTLTNDPPAPDLEAYRRINPAFPSDPTTRLFFDEAQFEAYRALGYYIARKAFRGHFPPTQDDAACFGSLVNAQAQTGRVAAHMGEPVDGSASPNEEVEADTEKHPLKPGR